MYTPSGLVIARITARNTKICIQPLVVISEFLRSQQRIKQVDHQTCAYDQHNDRFSVHIDLSSANSIAELHITQRQQEERYRDHNKDQVLHTTSFKSRTNAN
jgi:hypothetical protein